MKSLTGFGIRVDAAGDGHYGANRGDRKHNGIDYFCVPGQNIVAPFIMRIVRIAKPYANSDLSGVQWESGKSTGKIFYFQPSEALIGEYVQRGQFIGIAQAVSDRYENMTDHIHFQIDQ